jgi:hypothetical protein
MGRFWSLQVQVELTVPCYREEASQAFEYTSKFVSDRVLREIEKGKERTEELRGISKAAGGDEDNHPF